MIGSTLDSQLCMTGYELYRFDRRYRKGGGCIIYAKNDLNVVQLDIDILDRVGWGIAPRLEHMFLLAGYFK